MKDFRQKTKIIDSGPEKGHQQQCGNELLQKGIHTGDSKANAQVDAILEARNNEGKTKVLQSGRGKRKLPDVFVTHQSY